MSASSPAESALAIAKPSLDLLIQKLWSEGYIVIGPTLGEGAIVIDELPSARHLPIGWTDEQEAGRYRLKQRSDDAYFAYNVGPHSWKKYLFPPRLTLYSIELSEGKLAFEPADPAPPRYAFLGVRGCDLRAIEVQDRILRDGRSQDPHYRQRRERALVIAVSCMTAAPTCFCTSMGGGPRPDKGYDIRLTELEDRFLLDAGTPCGQALLDGLPGQPATPAELETARRQEQDVAAAITRTLDVSGMPSLFYENLNHPHWDDVAARCLSCANCTMVCPTCFCHSIEDIPSLQGDRAERVRVWDSCFNPQFGQVAGGNSRPQIKARYRQWLTHKLASWIDQFGLSGCVGCGRCITWCPVGIDLTVETAAIRGGAQS